MLLWKPEDFLECLEVVPCVGDYETSYDYRVAEAGLELQVTVWPCESVVRLALGPERAAAPALEFALFVRGQATLHEVAGCQHIELADCVLAASRFSYLEIGNVFDHARFPRGMLVRLAAKPHIKIELPRN